ncbi:MAG: TrbI/VirB10 family protein [Bdellovibrionia bacterium]
MHFSAAISNYFLTEPELITGRKRFRWKQTGIAAVVFIFLLMVGFAVFGKSEAPPDDGNFQSVSAEDVSKKGALIFSTKDASQSRGGSSGYRGPQYPDSSAEQSQVINRKDRARNEYSIPSGTKITAILEGELNSELGQTPVVAVTQSSLIFQGRTLIPAGSKILGKTGTDEDSERIGIVFDQIVYPNGHQVSASGLAMMSDGSPGVVGSHHSSRPWKIAGAIGTSFISGASAAFQTTTPNAFGIHQAEGSTRNAILNGVAQATLDQAKRFGEEAQTQKGYVTLPSGSTFLVYFEREVDLSGVLE